MNILNANPKVGSAIILVLGVLVVIIFTLPINDPLNQWLHRWQTLVGGGLAVIAAFVTVSEMRASSDQQSKSHQQLVALSLRKEAIEVRPRIQYFEDWFKTKAFPLHRSIHTAIMDWETLQRDNTNSTYRSKWCFQLGRS